MLHMLILLVLISMVSLLSAQAVIWEETFSPSPTGWSLEGNWGFQPDYLRFNWSPSATNYDMSATSPTIALPATVGNVVINQYYNDYSSNGGEMLEIIAIHDSGETVLWEYATSNGDWGVTSGSDIEFSLVPYANQTIQLKFRSYGGSTFNINWWNINNIAILGSIGNDLAAISISGNITPTVAEISNYIVKVKNNGSLAQNEYSVRLMQGRNIELLTLPGEPIDAGEVIDYVFGHAFTEEGSTQIWGEVVLANDEIPENNTTNNLNLIIQPEGTIAITIGDGTTSANTLPFNFYYKNNISQVIYMAEEINIGGMLTSIVYYNNFTQTLAGKEVKIWLAETDLTNLTDGWLPYSEFTQVFNGVLDFPIGQNEIIIPLDTAFAYGGQNLVVMANRAFEDQYWASGDHFYYTETPEYPNRARWYQSDSNVVNPENIAWAGTLGARVPNTTFFFNTSGLGSLEGHIYSLERNPIEGAEISVLGTNFVQYSDENGYYHFPFLFEGSFDIQASAFAHFVNTTGNVAIIEDQTTTLDIHLEPFPKVSVSGFVSGSDFPSVGLVGALVELTGFDNYQAETDENGNFLIAGVYANNTYDLNISYPGFANYSGAISVYDTDLNAGTFTLNEIAEPVSSVTASLTEQETAMVIWTLPGQGGGQEQWIHYDNGTNADGIGTGGAADFDVAIRFEPSQLEDLDSMYLTKVNFFPREANCEYSIRVWTGANAANLIVDQPVANPAINDWNEIQLITPIQIDANQELWIGYRANTQAGHPAGCDAGPAVTGYGDMIQFGGTWVSINQEYGLNYNWNIQGWVSNSARGEMATQILPNPSRNNSGLLDVSNKKLATSKPASVYSRFTNRALESFTVYRLMEGEEADEAYWSQLATISMPETSYEDMEFANLSAGMYRFAVKANYTNQNISPSTFSNTVPLGMHSQVTVNVTTNSGDSPSRATVTLTNTDNNPEHVYVSQVQENEAVIFPAVWKGQYWIDITLSGFADYHNEVEFSNDTDVYNAELIELLSPPANLTAVTGNNQVHLTWELPSAQYTISLSDRSLQQYHVYRDSLLIDTVAAGTTEYTDLNAINGNSYSYFVIAEYTTGESQPSNTVQVYLPHYGTLAGMVFDVNQAPLESATISAEQFSAMTNPSGEYFLDLPVGNYEVAASKADYVSGYERNVLIEMNQTTALNFSLILQSPTQLEYQVQSFNNVFLSWDAPIDEAAPEDILLHYDDGVNFEAIGTGGAADFDVAIRFEPSQLTDYNGHYLTKVDFFPRVADCEYSIRVWQGTNASTLMADQLVTNPVINEWNSVTLESPVQINASQELWFGYRANTQEGNPAGCDAGPAVAGFGDMIFFGGSWASMQNAYGLNYNWNIQGHVSINARGNAAVPLANLNHAILNNASKVNNPFKISNLPNLHNRALLGYNIYRDGSLIAEQVQSAYFTDTGLIDGTYTYFVTAVFDDGESNPTNSVDVTILAGNIEVILFEDFEEGIIPDDWDMTTNSAVGWFVTLDGSSAYWNIPPGDSYYACSNDDEANDDSSLDYLITPVLSFYNYDSISLNFRSYFTGAYSQAAHVKISTDGINWMEVGSVPTATSWTNVEIDLSGYIGYDQIGINFHASDNGEWASGWAIDNVLVTGILPGNPQYGDLAGFIRDFAGNSIQGAFVKANKYTLEYSTYSATDGSYLFTQLPVGNYTVSTSAEHYQDGIIENVEILAGQTTNLDISLFDEAYPPTEVYAEVISEDIAEVIWNAPNPERKQIALSQKQDRALEMFKIFRFLDGEEDQQAWTELGTVPFTETTFTDDTIATIPFGVYRYAVQALYSSAVVSESALSNVVPIRMDAQVTVNVTTNSGDSTEGAIVTLTNSDNNPEHVYSEVVTGSSAIFPMVWKGEYSLTIRLGGFAIYHDEVALLNEYEELYALLTEIFTPPTQLEYEVEESMVHLNWTAPNWIGDELEEGFEDGILPDGWLAIDNNNDGHNWFPYDANPHTGNWSIASASWWQSAVLNPDNYLVTPQIELGSYNELRFWVAAQDPAFPADHYKVLISTTGTEPTDFDIVLFEETLIDDVWKEIVIDLSAYANQIVYIAWHHTDCSDEFVMKLDDISVVNTITREIVFTSNFERFANYKTSMKPTRKFERNRALLGYNIYRDGYLLNDAVVEDISFTDHTTTNDFTHSYYVTAVYTTGESGSTNTVEAYVPPKVAIPVFTPDPNVVYTEPVAITIECETEDAAIQYRFVYADRDGSWMPYEEPIELDYDSVTALEARAFKEGWAISDVAFAVFTVTGTVAAPTFTPDPSMIYTEPVSVVLETATEGAAIQYRIAANDKESITVWLNYEAPIELDYNTVTTIEARAIKDNWTNSEIVSETYTVTGTVATPTFSPNPEVIYTEPIGVSIETETDAATIEYRFVYAKERVEPDWLVYTEPIQLDYDTITTIETRATKQDWITSEIVSATYTITGTVAAPTFSPDPSVIYTEPIAVTLETETEDATIEYRFAGLRNWAVYTEPIELYYDSVTTLEARASKEDWITSEITSATYTITGTVVTPTFSPSPDVIYTEPISVSIETETDGATIEYRYVYEDKSTPEWNTYSEPIELGLDSVTTIEARASKENWITSEITSATYTITGTVELSSPYFDIEPGIYQTAQAVAIITEPYPADAIIRYTTDSSNPDESSAIYAEPIEVPLNTTIEIKIRAFKENWLPSEMYSGIYTITGTVAIPTFSPDPSMIYTEPIAVVLESETEGAAIEYRFIDDRNWEIYTEPIQLGYDSITTIEARASKENWIISGISSATYTITGTVATPTFLPYPDGFYNDTIEVSIQTEAEDAALFYRFAGELDWLVYTEPIFLDYNTVTTIEAMATKENWLDSDIATATYTIIGKVATPTFSPDSETIYTEPIEITIHTATEDAVIEFRTSLDSGFSWSDWQLYDNPIDLGYDSTIDIEAKASKEDWLDSEIAFASYLVTSTVATPTFNPAPGLYFEAIDVVIYSATDGATVHYRSSVNEGTWSDWEIYTSPIPIPLETDMDFEAYATKELCDDSQIAYASYSITNTAEMPSFTPDPSVIYTESIAVTLQTETEEATIEYRFAPAENWLVYAEPIQLDYDSVTTIEARTVKENWGASEIATATYTITGTVAAPTFSHESGVYTEPISVTLETVTEGATIEYQIAGQRNWVVYTEPIELAYNTVTTIEARASKENWITSDIVSATYTITGTVAAPTFSHESGIYSESIAVTLETTTEGATIEYQIAGQRNWVVYTAPIELELNSITTIEARASKENWITSEIVSATYTITGTVATPTFSHESGTYSEPIAVTLETVTEGAIIEYQIAGNRNWVVYTAPIELELNSVTTIEARASKENWVTSEIVSATYTITGTVAAPTFSHESGVYTEPIAVTLETTTEDAIIEYQIAGNRNWVVYTAPIELELNSVTTIEARASKENWVTSEIVSATYTITGTVAAPTFSHESGIYTEPISVTLETTTEGAIIEYQIAGNRNWVVYTAPIELELNSVTTIEARASKENWVTSEIVSATYTITGTVAAPTFSHESGIYTEPIAVTLETTTEDATIEYRFADTRNWIVYTEPIELDYSTVTTIEARASKENWITSDIVSETYTITGTVAAPTFSLESGTYTEPIAVTLETTTEDATIEYRFADTRNWIVYTEPIELDYNTVTTIEARASKENWITSDIVSETYTITGTVATPTFSPEGGTYTEPIAVIIETTTEDATIEYRFADTRNWVVYTEPIELDYDTVTTIEARASKENWITSDIVSETYTITGTVAAPTFSHESGVYTEPIAVTLETTTEGAIIEYQIAGNRNWVVYTTPIELELNSVTTIEARASKENWITSEIVSATYTITGTVAAPTFSHESGVYTEPIAVTLETTTEGAIIEYQIAGNRNWVVYTTPIELELNSVTTIEARASKENWVTSEIVSATYTITGTVAAPTFSHESGVYTEPIAVTLETTTEDAIIEYQIAGNRNWVVYTAPIELELNSVTTIEARASKENWVTSEIVSETYTITGMVATPTFSPEGGIYNVEVTVEIFTETENATIYYTLNGEDPDENSEVYSTPLTFTESTTLKARAYKENWIASDIAMAEYEITGSVATPTANPSAGTYLEAQLITLSCATPEAVIRYTTDSTEPNETSDIYTQPLTIQYSTVIKAKAYRENWTPSGTLTAEYHILHSPTNLAAESGYLYVNLTWEMPEIPVITIFSAKKNSIQERNREVFLGYNIYRNGGLLNEELVITEAFEDLTVEGSVSYNYYVTAVYEEGESNPSNTVYVTAPNMVATPEFSPESGYYEEAIEIVISSSTPDATIYYTLDGSEPTHLSEEYMAPLALEGIVHIKARAYKEGWLPSEIAEAEYEIIITESGEVIILPTVTAFETVYPNPFNPSATIRYSLAEDSYVTLQVYNAKGQKVGNLLSENKQRGFYHTVWNGKNDSGKSMPSGVYFFVLQTNEQRFVRKAMLLK
jgi:hypothetical protein